jgi:hypothetical protein
MVMKQLIVDGFDVSVSGSLCRVARLRNEGYEFLSDPEKFMRAFADLPIRADILTFTQGIGDSEPKYPYRLEWHDFAVLPIETYEHWWKRQINDKTRNRVRKAYKMGVTLRNFELSDELVRAIKIIYDESPLRQGRRFKHYGKDLETLRQIHATYLDRSEFIGAFLDDELIGFVKLVHQPGWSSMMQIISLNSHRDKSPTNALIARAVEICAEKKVPKLQYGIWSRRGIGDFKLHHDFRPYRAPRYYAPLSFIGRTVVRTGLHQPLAKWVPEQWLDRGATLRAYWNDFRFRERPADSRKNPENRQTPATHVNASKALDN